MALSNSQYEAIMRIYNQRQFRNRQEQDERIKEVYEKVPQIEALTDEITATMAQEARYVLMGEADRAAAMKQEAAQLKEQKAQYLARNGYPEDYLEMQYHCPKCRDTGRIDGRK